MKYNFKWSIKKEKNELGSFFYSIFIIDEESGVNDKVLEKFTNAIVEIIGSGSNRIFLSKVSDEKTNVVSNVRVLIHENCLNELFNNVHILEEKGFLFVKKV